MLKTIALFIAIVCSSAAFGQAFEGKITYTNTYVSKMPTMTSEQFTSMMGSQYDYFIKDGNYKNVSNGSALQYQLYINEDNKLYTKMAGSETLMWYDGATNPDEILKVEHNKNVVEVLGYPCDEIVMTLKSGVQKFYFSKDIPADPKIFSNHKFGNWAEFVLHSSALPLKITLENAQFTLVSVATEIQPMEVDKTMMMLPANATVIKNPF